MRTSRIRSRLWAGVDAVWMRRGYLVAAVGAGHGLELLDMDSCNDRRYCIPV